METEDFRDNLHKASSEPLREEMMMKGGPETYRVPPNEKLTQMRVPKQMEQLLCFRFGPIWDGNLISKQARDELVDGGYLERSYGFQFLTAHGVNTLKNLGFLHPETWRENER